ncbi:flagellar biosynthesis protein [Dissulfurispira thermophila]|uniref:Flagellar biosynthesis protein n=2 Tax=root TaxID=1 RepID=A0A7G1H2Q8_9BACT|nr:flagellar biosynthetic protein FliR [Dissulfurispira thermophila]BCB96459.1 flagellar biosynthesis protein [Dissulfurispira thermophila]
MELYNLINTYAEKFIPVFIRIAVMLSFIPFIGARMTPMMVRVGIAVALTLLLLPVVNVNIENPVRSIFEAFFVGSAIGLTARIILGAVETAAQWMSIEMGIGVAAVFNPMFGEQIGPLSLFYTFVSMGLFFMLDMHHYFIEAIVRSFDMSSIQYKGIFDSIIKLNSILFPLALKIAAPIILVQVLINLAMGFLSRALPQANIFFISFPLLITSGIIFMALSLPFVLMVVSKAFVNVKDAIMVFTR